MVVVVAVKIPSFLKLRSVALLFWVSKLYGANDDRAASTDDDDDKEAADGPLSKPYFSSNVLILSRSSLRSCRLQAALCLLLKFKTP